MKPLAGPTAEEALRYAGQLPLDARLVEPHDPPTAYLYNWHSRLACLLDEVLGRFRITLYIDLFEAYPVFF
jgi:hypothetical protein